MHAFFGGKETVRIFFVCKLTKPLKHEKFYTWLRYRISLCVCV